MIVDTSRRVREWMAGKIRAPAERQLNASNERRAATAARIEVAKVEVHAEIDRVAAVLARHVRHRHELGDQCDRRHARDTIGRDRSHLNAGIGVAVERGWIVETSDGFHLRGDGSTVMMRDIHGGHGGHGGHPPRHATPSGRGHAERGTIGALNGSPETEARLTPLA
jgi:hypothetical protein